MSEVYVERTCTHLGGGVAEIEAQSHVSLTGSRPLSEFRNERAYVLLGDAGLGKTTEFRNEWEALGDSAELLSARDLLTLEIKPEWRDKTLFIDGLDEIRAGSADGRSALDEIRNRLDRLGWPSYRISCREADWLGSNDRRRLESATPGESVAVLRLDPLDQEARRALLAVHLEVEDVSEFLREADQRGLGGILDNPLTLEMLAGAVAHGGGAWPASRREMFELACVRMAQEHNDEHIAATAVLPTVEAVLITAGELAAIQLLSGIEGFSLGPTDDHSPYVSLDSLQPSDIGTSGEDSSLLRHVLGTKLFCAPHATGTLEDWPERVPSHRHIAEFLGGRYLAHLVDNGLPARRVVALMVSPHDGRVVTSQRGLSAWFAAHSSEALTPLIDADPVGIGLYGDVSQLNGEQKRRLLHAVATYAATGPLLGHERRDGRIQGYRDSTAWAFRSIVDPGTAEAMADLLRGNAEDPASDRIAEFMLRVLAEAEGANLDAAEPLAAIALAIAREPNWSAQTRRAALDAFVHLEAESQARDDALMALLTDIGQRRLTDPDDDLAGLALRGLYPHRVSPAKVWSYLGIRTRENYHGVFDSFWSYAIVNQSSAHDAASALDALWAELPHQSLRSGIDSVLGKRAQDMMPVELLARALDELGDEADITRLFGWLAAAAICGRDIQPAARQGLSDAISKAAQALGPQAMEQLVDSGTEEESAIDKFADPARPVREWLEGRPEKQCQLYMEWLKTCHDDGLYGHRAWHWPAPLFFSTLPGDLGSRSLEQALVLEASDPDLATDILRHVVRRQVEDSTINKGLTLDSVHEATKSSPLLSAELERLLSPSPWDAEHDAFEAEMHELGRENARKELVHRQQWADHIRDSSQALSDGSFPVDQLDYLARIYFGHRYGSDQDASGQDRLTEFLQGDCQIAAAVMDAMVAAVFRAELPTVDESISLHAESKHAWAAWPLFAGLQLVERDEPGRFERLDGERKRRVLATYFCVPHSLDRTPPWLQRWLAADPELVNDVLVRCVIGDVRAGSESSFALNELVELGFDECTKHQARLRVLKSFPPRGSNAQLRLLDRLLLGAMAHPASQGLRELIDEKLTLASMTVAQRTHWLAAGALVFEDRYVPDLAEHVMNHPSAIRHVAAFFHSDHGPGMSGHTGLTANVSSGTLAAFVEMLGPAYPPLERDGLTTVEIDAADRVSDMIHQLAQSPDDVAGEALRRFEHDSELREWQAVLRWRREEQSAIQRDAEYLQPSVHEVQQALSGGNPANAADLAALLLDRLDDIGSDMRGGTNDPWSSYWNVDAHGRPTAPRHENRCRDSLLSHLKNHSTLGEVDIGPEGSYAAGKRADIRASCASFNVPIEIKRQSHRDLWNAMHRQLIGQYTTDPATDGYGIYLVLWFGGDEMPTPASGLRPRSPDELREMLEADLSIDEARKISVRVIDVTKPGS
ncbi:hypothetical protein [Candidatus Poriferisodalis sp.]|uniref:hypothetical protein n=1 Tax=Candidatus Poriferisodalis sp. TaxID=3101277 RepID=UPI003B02EC04